MFGVSANTLTASDRPDPEVISWLRSLDYGTERLGHLVSTLADRLAPILTPPSPETKGEASCPASCQVALEIQGKVARINAIESAINDLLARLAV